MPRGFGFEEKDKNSKKAPLPLDQAQEAPPPL